MKRFLSILLASLLALALIGCAAAPSASPAAQSAPTEAPAAESAPTETPAETEAPAETAAVSPFVGDWKLCAQEGEIASATREELEAQAQASGLALSSVMSVSLRGDGTLSFCIYGTLADGAWSDGGDGSGTLQINGQDCAMNVSDGLLRLDLKAYVAVFEPSEQSAEAAAAAVPQQSDPGYQKPEEKPRDPRFVGEWRFYDRASDDPSLVVLHEDLPKLRQQGKDYAGDYTLSIGDDGWFKCTDFYGFERNNWTDNGDGTASLNVEGKACTLSAADGYLLLTSPDSVTRYERTAELGDPMAEDGEDRTGLVLERLDGDHFPVRYRVQADDGEIYECKYYDFGELEPGTEVTISAMGKSWRIEPVDSGFAFGHGTVETPAAALYTTADGITVDDLSVQLAGGKVWSFSYTLANPTAKDAEFDPSLFVLTRADGTELKTMAPYVSKDTVKAGTTYFRISINIGKADALKLGDEISFAYDGTSLGSVTAEEF